MNTTMTDLRTAKENFAVNPEGNGSLTESWSGSILKASINSHGPAQITVLDVLGKVVAECEHFGAETPSTYQFDLRHEPAGSYFLRATMAGKPVTHKIVLQK